MKNIRKNRDNRILLLKALIRHADSSSSADPHFYVDEMAKTLDVCTHDFNIMLRQLGNTYCHLADSFEGRSRYIINVDRCLRFCDQLVRENNKKKAQRRAVRNTLLAASVGTFLVLLFNCCF